MGPVRLGGLGFRFAPQKRRLSQSETRSSRWVDLTRDLPFFFDLTAERIKSLRVWVFKFRDFRIVVKRIGACGGQSLRTLKGTGVTALPEKICEKNYSYNLFCLELYSQKTIIRLFGGTSFPEKYKKHVCSYLFVELCSLLPEKNNIDKCCSYMFLIIWLFACS